MSSVVLECDASEARCSWQRLSCTGGQSEVSTDCSGTDCSESDTSSPPKDSECEPLGLWKIPPPFPKCLRKGRARSKEFFDDQDIYQIEEVSPMKSASPLISASPKKRDRPPRSPMTTPSMDPRSLLLETFSTPDYKGPPARQISAQSGKSEPSTPMRLCYENPSTPMRLPVVALFTAEVDGSMEETPKAKKEARISMTETPKAKEEITNTPPSGPAMLQRRLRDDIEAALGRKSLPLLSLALTRSHCCGADHCLHEAVRRQHVKALKFLLQHSTNCQVDDHCNALRPLHNAIQHSMSKDGAGFQMAEVLLAFGASPDSCCGDDPSLGAPLHMAARKGSIAMAALLLAHGADPNALDANGQTPLHVSCGRVSFHPDIVEDQVARLLITHGANPFRDDALGLSPSDCASSAGMQKLLRQATKTWTQQQLAPVRGAVNGCVDQQVPWILPEILDKLASCL